MVFSLVRLPLALILFSPYHRLVLANFPSIGIRSSSSVHCCFLSSFFTAVSFGSLPGFGPDNHILRALQKARHIHLQTHPRELGWRI